jgi:hypothetical protein
MSNSQCNALQLLDERRNDTNAYGPMISASASQPRPLALKKLTFSNPGSKLTEIVVSAHQLSSPCHEFAFVSILSWRDVALPFYPCHL